MPVVYSSKGICILNACLLVDPASPLVDPACFSPFALTLPVCPQPAVHSTNERVTVINNGALFNGVPISR